MSIGTKTDRMSIKNIALASIARPSKIYPNWDFWSENKPSGNPATGANPTIVTYNPSPVKMWYATSSLVRFLKQKHFLLI
jgi:hypothetical protein